MAMSTGAVTHRSTDTSSTDQPDVDKNALVEQLTKEIFLALGDMNSELCKALSKALHEYIKSASKDELAMISKQYEQLKAKAEAEGNSFLKKFFKYFGLALAIIVTVVLPVNPILGVALIAVMAAQLANEIQGDVTGGQGFLNKALADAFGEKAAGYIMLGITIGIALASAGSAMTGSSVSLLGRLFPGTFGQGARAGGSGAGASGAGTQAGVETASATQTLVSRTVDRLVGFFGSKEKLYEYFKGFADYLATASKNPNSLASFGSVAGATAMSVEAGFSMAQASRNMALAKVTGELEKLQALIDFVQKIIEQLKAELNTQMGKGVKYPKTLQEIARVHVLT